MIYYRIIGSTEFGYIGFEWKHRSYAERRTETGQDRTVREESEEWMSVAFIHVEWESSQVVLGNGMSCWASDWPKVMNE